MAIPHTGAGDDRWRPCMNRLEGGSRGLAIRPVYPSKGRSIYRLPYGSAMINMARLRTKQRKYWNCWVRRLSGTKHPFVFFSSGSWEPPDMDMIKTMSEGVQTFSTTGKRILRIVFFTRF